MPETATLQVQGKTYSLPVVVGTENEVAVDISKLRAESGVITLDDGYSNTGSCQSAITFIDGEKGHPALPRHPDRAAGRAQHLRGDRLAADLRRAADGRAARSAGATCSPSTRCCTRGSTSTSTGSPRSGHPMAILSAMINAAELLQPRHHQDGEPGDVPGRGGAPAEQDRGRSRRPPTRRPSASRSSTRSRTSTTARTSCT